MKLKFSIFIILSVLGYSAFSQQKTKTPKTKKDIIAEVEKLTDDYVLFIDSFKQFLINKKAIAPDDGTITTPFITETGSIGYQDYLFNWYNGPAIENKTAYLIDNLMKILPDTISDNNYLNSFKEYLKIKENGYTLFDKKTEMRGEKLHRTLTQMEYDCLDMQKSLLAFKSRNDIENECHKLTKDYILFIDSIKIDLQRQAKMSKGFYVNKSTIKPLKSDVEFFNEKRLIIQEKTADLIYNFLQLFGLKFTNQSTWLLNFIEQDERTPFYSPWSYQEDSLTAQQYMQELTTLQEECIELRYKILNDYLNYKADGSYSNYFPDSAFNKICAIQYAGELISINNRAFAYIYPINCSFKNILEVAVNGIPIKYSEDRWVFESDTLNRLGDYKIMIDVKYRSDNNRIKILSRYLDFNVFNPKVLISVNPNDVLYEDYENKVTISAAGHRREDLECSFPGATARKIEPAVYIVEVRSKSLKEILAVTTWKGTALGRDTFKVQPLPNMIIKLNDYLGESFTKDSIINAECLTLQWPAGIIMRQYYSVSNYTCTITHKGKSYNYVVDGNKITDEIKKRIKECISGDLVVFTSIKAITESGKVTDRVDPLVITIK